MDKTRDVGGVKASRFSSTNRQIIKQSETVRRLSFVGRVCSNNSDCEMGSVQSDGEDDFRIRNSCSSKRFKLPKKFFDDCITVEHASVPRKLRSAINKRSPGSKRLKHFSNGVELLRNDRMKKSKLKQHEELEGSSGQATVGPISKDEEEVAETLYALAGMFSDTENKIKIDSDCKSSKGKALLLPEAENSVHASKDAKDLKMTYPTSGTDAPPWSSSLEGSGGETAEMQVSKQGTELELPQRKQEALELQSRIHKSNHPAVSLFSKSPVASETQTSIFTGIYCSERRWGAGLNQPLHDLNINSGKTKEIDVVSVATSRNHHELQPAIRENKNYGSALWPGLSSTGLHNAVTAGHPLKLSAAKLPAWLGSPSSTSRPCSAGNTVLAEMEPRPPGTKKPCKKCSIHVDICRLIKVLQTTEGKDVSPLQPTQLTMHGGLSQGVSQASKLHLVFENGSNGVLCPNGVASSGADKILNEINNAIFLHKRLLEDQQQASISIGTYASQNQSLNFMPLSSGGCGVLAKSVVGRPGNGPGQEPSTPLHLFPQNHTTMSVHLPQNHHTSSYLDHNSASGASQRFQIQVPPYLSNSISGQLPSSTPLVFPKQQQQQQQQQFQQFQQQQQQQWFSAAQLGIPHKPGESAAAPISNRQNDKHEPPPCILQYAHQMEGPRHHPFSLQQQQQHQFISSTSFSSPQNIMQRYHPHHRNGGVFRPDGASSLQLLCNEQL